MSRCLRAAGIAVEQDLEPPVQHEAIGGPLRTHAASGFVLRFEQENVADAAPGEFLGADQPGETSSDDDDHGCTA